MQCGDFFFFKQKTAYEMRISDWSSDVCSSDLVDLLKPLLQLRHLREIDLGKMLLLVREQLRFILQRLDLLIDLLEGARGGEQILRVVGAVEHRHGLRGDRKSTRLNSSH